MENVAKANRVILFIVDRTLTLVFCQTSASRVKAGSLLALAALAEVLPRSPHMPPLCCPRD
eukprot:16442519-Heterocapsa_arctica.AAC.1